jgi:hypothetical protein
VARAIPGGRVGGFCRETREGDKGQAEGSKQDDRTIPSLLIFLTELLFATPPHAFSGEVEG